MLGFPIGVAKKFAEDDASSLAVLIAYWAFLSLFPLLLAFTAILGFVLQDNPQLQRDVVTSVIAHVPVIGDQLRRDPTSLTGNPFVTAIRCSSAGSRPTDAQAAAMRARNNCREASSSARRSGSVPPVTGLPSVSS